VVATLARAALWGIAGLVTFGVLLSLGALLGNAAPVFAPPGPLARLSRYLTHNTVSTGPGSLFPELRLEEVHATPKQVRQAVIAFTQSRPGWMVADAEPPANTLHLVVTSRLLGFKDDVQVTLLPGEGGTVLHIESASRVGRGDFGANLAHVRALRRAVTEALAH